MSQKRKNKKRKPFMRVFMVSIFIFILLGFGVIYGLSILNKVDSVDIIKDDTNLGINDGAIEIKDVVNIALFGLDEEENENGSRADSIMIATLDRVHKKIKLTSIMRDTYVEIEGHNKDKINHSYAFGGPELSIKTINQNFHMNIREFITVDFFGLEKIIDTLNGLQVDVKKNEILYVNRGVRDTNKIYGGKVAEITESGFQTLNGRQAVAYSRIRMTGDGDFERTERQRLVLEQVIHKGLNSGITKYPALLNTTLPFITTSLSKKEILSLGTFVFTRCRHVIDDVKRKWYDQNVVPIPEDNYREVDMEIEDKYGGY